MTLIEMRRLARDMRALAKGKRLPHHVEKRDKNGRRYWGPPDADAGATPPDVRQAVDGLRNHSGILANEAANRSRGLNSQEAALHLIEHTPLDQLRELPLKHRQIVGDFLGVKASQAMHRRLAKKWRTPSKEPGNARWDNVRHFGTQGVGGSETRDLFPVLIDRSAMPDHVRDRVHDLIRAAHRSTVENVPVHVPKKRRRPTAPKPADDSWMGPEAPPEGADHTERAHHHLHHAEQALRAAGKHEAADAVATARVEAQHGPVHEQIHAAYEALERPSQGFVHIADLREKLHPDIPRGHVDRALTHMFFTESTHLRPNENTKSITPRDAAAAIHLGGKARHFMVVPHG